MDPLTTEQRREVSRLLHIAERYAQRFACVTRYAERTVSYDDYYQAAARALCECVQRRRPGSSESEFIRYCDVTVYGRCKMLVRDDVRQGTLRPRPSTGGVPALSEATDALLAYGILPTPERLAQLLNVPVESIERAMIAPMRVDEEPDCTEMQMGTPAPDVSDLAERAERDARVREAVRRLPARLRRIVHLRYQGQLTIEDIAARCHCSASTVKNRLREAKGILRPWLAELDTAGQGVERG